MGRFPIHLLAVPLMALSGSATLLAGCQSSGERVIARANREDTCGARQLRAFVGRTADQTTRDRIEGSVSNRRRVRWIVPGEDILADLNTGRINVVLDDTGKIRDVSCY